MDNLKEVWKQFMDTKYMVSSLGRVVSMKKRYWRILKPSVDKDGYQRVDICYNKTIKHYHIHRLVAICFIQNSSCKPCINHKNGIKLDNRVVNLEWVTISENTKHAYDNGLFKGPIGEKNRHCKLTKSDVLHIRECSLSDKEFLSKKYDISIATVYDIINRRSWNHI